MFSGISVSPGVALAQAVVLSSEQVSFDRSPVASEFIEREIDKFKNAVAESVKQLTLIETHVREKMGDDKAAIFEGHLMLVEDEELSETVIEVIRGQRFPAPAAVEAVINEHASAMEEMEDEYLKARAVDMRDLGHRLVLNCLGIAPQSLETFEFEVIIVAEDLTPSQAAVLDTSKVKGIITERGSRTSHTAIMAASMEIPAIVAVEGVSTAIQNGDMVALDAEHNQIIVNPTPSQLDQVEYRREQFILERKLLEELRDLPARTSDGVRIKLAANIGSPADSAPALLKGAEGVGLYRVEFLFMETSEAPDEEMQYQAFKSVVDDMKGMPVVIRTLDVGGDKDLPYLALPKEENPFLGCRGIRLCFERPSLLLRQLRALLRAGVHGDIRILVPMISSVDEVRRFKEFLAEAQSSLEHEGIAYAKDLPVGVMIETPAAVFLAPHLIRETDFFSIGTNDLTQYTLAVDRQNERIAELFEQLSPAVLLGIKHTVDAAREEGKPVCVCGQMAGDVLSALLLVGLGVEELSMSPVHIPRVKNAIRKHSCARLRDIARDALGLATAAEVKAKLEKYLG
ncbi:phosphoenolpyruvate--protein phosphotransferase [Maridesulfovibrio hydrothermalis]|uniref:Phosphoenolpyruvate-protein phosphotransferase n=1 Tax=Maridesulfovibrio hydrothermalis AM13 = DSM 14728 TaxID=1121451 RepID=L0RB50_9BACT|nr:phosphoenolpyruvate--protein phosphotransferase [Maridesulfovibrio hydrothermalis]CCO23405.1 phosphotransferase system (PTS) enzyme I [Maridesulfovibrio hydrothermalis AM13 = DSM 14728]